MSDDLRSRLLRLAELSAAWSPEPQSFVRSTLLEAAAVAVGARAHRAFSVADQSSYVACCEDCELRVRRPTRADAEDLASRHMAEIAASAPSADRGATDTRELLAARLTSDRAHLDAARPFVPPAMVEDFMAAVADIDETLDLLAQEAAALLASDSGASEGDRTGDEAAAGAEWFDGARHRLYLAGDMRWRCLDCDETFEEWPADEVACPGPRAGSGATEEAERTWAPEGDGHGYCDGRNCDDPRHMGSASTVEDRT